MSEQATALQLRELLGFEPMAVAPPAEGVRDSLGRFLPGHSQPGPGRPKGQGLDLRALAEREAEREGFDLCAAAWRVIKKLFAMAEQGDVAAAKELFTRIGTVDDDAQQAGVALTVVTGVDDLGQPATGIALRVAQRTGDTNA